MRSEYEFSQGIRGKHAGKRLRIVGDRSSVLISHSPASAKAGSSNNLVGTAGEYYVCAELCMRGYLALLTPKNNPLFDVVATDADGKRAVSIQVKTRSIQNKQGWKLGTDIAKGHASPGLFVVLVNL